MQILTLDIESFYDREYTLSRLTTESYIRDPRFQVIGVGIRNADNSARVWLEHDQFKAWAASVDWSEIALVAHHAHFDGLILSHHYGVRPAMWFDTLSMANACRPWYPRKGLAALGQAEGIGTKGDEVIHAKGKRREDFTQQEWQQYGVYCLNDCDMEYALFEKYRPEFSIRELRLIDITIRMFTEPVLTMNSVVLAQHHAAEIKRKAELLDRCIADKDLLMSNDKFAQLLLELGVDPPRKLSEAKTKAAAAKGEPTPVYSWAFAKTDPGMKALVDHDDPVVAALAAARVGIKSTIEETRAKRYLGIVSRGLWTVYLAFSKAHTGRWAGGDKANAQNLKRGGILRDAIEAPEGYRIIVADSAQIEARRLAHVACETQLVKAFAEKRDVYSEFASEAYQRPVNRKRKEVVDGKEVFPDFNEGFVGKTSVLGLGYGMAGLKFAITMLSGQNGPVVVFSRELLGSMHIDFTAFLNNPKKVNAVLAAPTRLNQADMLVHCIVADAFVQRYRGKYKAIVNFWDICNTAIEAMLYGNTYTFGRDGVYRTVKNGIVLPSGRVLHYPELACDNRQTFSYFNGKERTKLYGGLLCENIVQADCRDIVAYQALEYADTGRKVATLTHDEVVGVTPESDAQAGLATLLQIMHKPPEWAPGLPLAAEGGIGKRYGDAK
jgi:hypothetical protein